MHGTKSSFLERVAQRAGPTEGVDVERAVDLSLRALGAHLTATPALLAEALGPQLVASFEAGRSETPAEPDSLYDRLADELPVRAGVALELAQSIVAVFAERAGAALRSQLRHQLPSAWADLLVEPRPAATHVPAAPAVTDEHTLAAGRPGGARPIAGAGLPAGHRDSIAANDDPHAARKLSSTEAVPGGTDDTLAGGKPGSRHPVGGGEE
jgi:uncharacterized protein (DUF2267 family)